MTPLAHNGTVWSNTTAGDSNWYNYNNQRWANARDNNHNMFVWIPRYAYRIAYFDNSSNANARRANPAHTDGLLGFSTRHGMIEVDPISGDTNLVTGTLPTNVTGNVQTTAFSDYIPHPAFTFNSQRAGIWVGKYTTGFTGTVPGNANAPTRVVIQEGIRMWRSINASNMFLTATNFANPSTNGITGTSIMMRNRDWGAVAYLSHSGFGRNGELVTINDNSDFITGHGGNNASTTGNATGVFDMRGGAWEGKAAYVNNGNASLTDNASSIVGAGARYKDVYPVGSSDASANNYLASRNIVGNAVFETSTSGDGPGGAWFGAVCWFPDTTRPVFVRGGLWSAGSNAGVFSTTLWNRLCECEYWFPCSGSPIADLILD